MLRALGGAPTLSGQWRSLGRSLLANAVRVRRGSPLQQEKNSHSRRASSLQFYLTLKTNFLGKKLGRYAAINRLKTKRCVMPRLLRSVRQNKSMGRAWCGHARPNDYPLQWQDFDFKIINFLLNALAS
jgi:hypothetical protein